MNPVNPDNTPSRFLNRELSWLEFDRRVLALARDPERPLLERVKFLAIFFRNLDEFFQVRVADLQDQVAAGLSPSPDGRSPADQLSRIRELTIELSAQAHAVFRQELLPALAEAGIELASWSELDRPARALASEEYEAHIHPVLVPLAVDPAHPFPYVSGLSLSIGVILRRPDGEERFARVKVPPFVPRWLALGDGRYVPVEEVVLAHLSGLFPEDTVLESGVFRVTRDADLELRVRNSSGDLARDIEEGLQRRVRGSDAVRLEASATLGPRVRERLVEELELEDAEVYESPGLLDLGRLFELCDLDRPDLKEDTWAPRPVPGLPSSASGTDAFFAALRQRDFLVHHPYESFEGSVEGFLLAAAADPDVRVIMSTIYRTGGPESGIVRALEAAAAQGKQVVVLVELKARFDEAANLERARGLERAGAHVVYGLVGLKTHAKVALVVRQEGALLRRYCHVGTGNYNPVTAKLYEDMGLLTSSATVTRDVAQLFQRLTSGSGSRSYERMLVAPESLRSGLLERIADQAHEGGRIVIKLNSLSDPELIDALYAASRDGAQIDLVVRGICNLRPGVEGLSERIRVRSILGRFLEHSRIFRFGTPGRDAEHWIGSADMLPRNLDLRVEALVAVDDSVLRRRLDEILALYLDPDLRFWELAPDGSWKFSRGALDIQHEFMSRAQAG